MKILAAGLLAAAVAYVANRFFYRLMGNTVLLGPVPIVEEVCKTMSAALLGAAVFYTHLVFGLIEALLDWRGQKKGVLPACYGLIAHGAFGLITVAATQKTGMLIQGIFTAVIFHILWNMVMTYRTAKR